MNSDKEVMALIKEMRFDDQNLEEKHDREVEELIEVMNSKLNKQE